mmetsp:Transcript_52819/g.126348  ORF Transcript_52819/g.126348 Transcript_52819/m.126348 type:complete len:253 (-) Transcript_52819:196-954(-)
MRIKLARLFSVSIFTITCTPLTQAEVSELKEVKPREHLDHSKVISMLLTDTGLVRREPQPHHRSIVKCETTQGAITIELDSMQSPQGARRLLDLVRDGFFSDQAIFKAVRGFVAQFGISDNSDMNEKWSPTIPDDERTQGSFIPKGTVFLAADRPNARSTQVAVALADLSLTEHGRRPIAPWETPIGRVDLADLPVLDRLFTGYADGVDEKELLRNGNSYAREFYPRLDFVKHCNVPGDPVSELASLRVPEA